MTQLSRCVLDLVRAQSSSDSIGEAFFDDADGEVLADLDSGDEAPADETDMDEDAEAAEPSEVADMSLHCFRGHTGPARVSCDAPFTHDHNGSCTV